MSLSRFVLVVSSLGPSTIIPTCVIGKDFTDWLRRALKMDKSAALAIASDFLSRGYIYAIDPSGFDFRLGELYHLEVGISENTDFYFYRAILTATQSTRCWKFLITA